jgi:VIT1/CCC1 family predicted Fe2+/Mn2+ transporter
VRRLEERHIDQTPEGEREEIRQIFAAKGFDGKLLENVVATITHDRRRWVETMLVEEWGLQLIPSSPWRAALVTFTAFLVAGMVPLTPLLFAGSLTHGQVFGCSAVAAALMFFVTGSANGRLNHRNPWRSGLETLVVGGAAASRPSWWASGFVTCCCECNADNHAHSHQSDSARG